MRSSLDARETYVAETIFAARTHILLPEHVFPSIASMKTKLSSFEFCSLKMLPGIGERTKMVNGEIEVIKPLKQVKEK